MTAITNAVGFCLLKLLITALFSPAHTEPRKTPDTTAMAVNIPRGFRNLQGSNTRHVRADCDEWKLLRTRRSTGRIERVVTDSTKWWHVVPTTTWPQYASQTVLVKLGQEWDIDEHSSMSVCLSCFFSIIWMHFAVLRINDTNDKRLSFFGEKKAHSCSVSLDFFSVLQLIKLRKRKEKKKTTNNKRLGQFINMSLCNYYENQLIVTLVSFFPVWW